MEEEKIVNERVDKLLVEMEGIFKEAVEAHKPLQEKLDEDVRALMAEFDKREETKRFDDIKAKADFIALMLSMPLKEETKEKVVEEIVKGCYEDGDTTSESV